MEEAGIPFVSETAEDIPPQSASFPDLKLGTPLKKWLEGSGVLPRRHQTPVAYITYQSNGIDEKVMANNWIKILKLLVHTGVREIALPSVWRSAKDWGGGRRNPIERELTLKSLEGFLIVRHLEDDHDWCKHPLVPRVSFLPPEYSDKPVPENLLSVPRSLHLIILPENCRDAADPRRRIGEVRNSTIDLEMLEALLTL